MQTQMMGNTNSVNNINQMSNQGPVPEMAEGFPPMNNMMQQQPSNLSTQSNSNFSMGMNNMQGNNMNINQFNNMNSIGGPPVSATIALLNITTTSRLATNDKAPNVRGKNCDVLPELISRHNVRNTRNASTADNAI